MDTKPVQVKSYDRYPFLIAAVKNKKQVPVVDKSIVPLEKGTIRIYVHFSPNIPSDLRTNFLQEVKSRLEENKLSEKVIIANPETSIKVRTLTDTGIMNGKQEQNADEYVLLVEGLSPDGMTNMRFTDASASFLCGINERKISAIDMFIGYLKSGKASAISTPTEQEKSDILKKLDTIKINYFDKAWEFFTNVPDLRESAYQYLSKNYFGQEKLLTIFMDKLTAMQDDRLLFKSSNEKEIEQYAARLIKDWPKNGYADQVRLLAFAARFADDPLISKVLSDRFTVCRQYLFLREMAKMKIGSPEYTVKKFSLTNEDFFVTTEQGKTMCMALYALREEELISDEVLNDIVGNLKKNGATASVKVLNDVFKYGAQKAAFYPNGDIKDLFFERAVTFSLGNELKDTVQLYFNSGTGTVTLSFSQDGKELQFKAEGSADITIKGVEYRFSSTPLQIYSNGQVMKAYVSDYDGQEVDGFRYIGSIEFYSSGKVKKGCLKWGQTIHGVNYAKGDIEYYENGKVKAGQLANETEIAGVKYSGKYSDHSRIEYYQNGRVKKGHLAERHAFGEKVYSGMIEYNEDGTIKTGEVIALKIGEVLYQSDKPVEKFANGKVKKGVLYGDQKINGVEYSSSCEIEYYENGQIKKGYLNGGQTINNVNYSGYIEFYQNGNIKKGYIYGTYENIDDVGYEGYTDIEYHESGKVKKAVLHYNETINDVKFEKGSIIEYFPSGKVMKGRLYEEQTIGNTVYSGDIEFLENGSVKNGKKEKIKIGNGYCSVPKYYPGGELLSATLCQDTTIGSVTYRADTQIEFFQNGQVKSGYLRAGYQNEQQIGLVYYETYEYSPVEYYENGQVKTGRLARAQTIAEVRYAAGTIDYYENGQVKIAHLDEDQIINGLKYRNRVIYYENGQIKEGYLSENQKIDGRLYQGDIEYYENGIVKVGTLRDRASINGVKYDYYETIEYFQDGKVKKGTLSGVQTIDGTQYIGAVEYYPNGKLWKGRTADNRQTVQGKVIPRSMAVEYDQRGKLEKVAD